MPVLPQELFDAIIDEARHDTETLKCCSLLVSSFLSPSQRNLFRSVQVGRPGQDVPGTFFTKSPHLASYIRILSIHMASDLDAVALALRLALNTEHLLVSGRVVKWGDLGNKVPSALLDCIARPSLQRLFLVNMMDVPAAFLWAATTVPIVSFLQVRMDSNQDWPEMERLSDSSPAPRLRHLVLADSGFSICDFLLHPRNVAYIRQIECVDLYISAENASYHERMLAACAITLKRLVINPPGLTSIPILPSVLEVEFKIYIDASRKLPAFISSSLSQIASSLPLVETLTLIFTVEPLLPEVEWADEDPLPIFGAAFKNRTQLLHLRRVNCRLIKGDDLDSTSTLFDHFMRAMELRMPGLEGTGILTCVLAD